MTFHELDTIITRLGRNCKIIFCGDSYTLGEGLANKEQVYPYLIAKYFDIVMPYFLNLVKLYRFH